MDFPDLPRSATLLIARRVTALFAKRLGEPPDEAVTADALLARLDTHASGDAQPAVLNPAEVSTVSS